MFTPSFAGSYSVLNPQFNMIGSSNPYAPSVWSLSMECDASNDYINFGNNLTNDGTSAFTWSGWVKFEINGGTQIITSKLDGSNRGWEVNINGSSGKPTLLISNTAGADWLNSRCDTAIATNTWAFISVTYDGSKTFGGIKWYVDGVASTTTNDGAATMSGSSSSAGNLQINARNNSVFGNRATRYKETQYHTSELSAAQVLTHYNEGLPTDYLLTPTPPQHLWRCGDTGGDDFTAGTGQIQDTGDTGGITGTPTNTLGTFVTDAP
jgi:hypothetical protein